MLKPAHRDWLCALPAGPIEVDDLVEICHGSPFDEDAYSFDELDAVRALKVATRPLCLFGHTHYPVTFELSEQSFDSVGPAPRARQGVARRVKYCSTGIGRQRREARGAAYASSTTVQRRVEVPAGLSGRRGRSEIIKAGLPDVLGKDSERR